MITDLDLEMSIGGVLEYFEPRVVVAGGFVRSLVDILLLSYGWSRFKTGIFDVCISETEAMSECSDLKT